MAGDAEELELIDIMKTIEAEQQKATDDLAKQKQQKETDDEFTKEEAALRQAIIEGVDPRGSLGPRFQRDAGGGQNKAYKNLTGRQEKADFRRRWAQAQLEQVVESREREDEMKQVDTTKGDMVGGRGRPTPRSTSRSVRRSAPPGSSGTRCGSGTSAW